MGKGKGKGKKLSVATTGGKSPAQVKGEGKGEELSVDTTGGEDPPAGADAAEEPAVIHSAPRRTRVRHDAFHFNEGWGNYTPSQAVVEEPKEHGEWGSAGLASRSN